MSRLDLIMKVEPGKHSENSFIIEKLSEKLYEFAVKAAVRRSQKGYNMFSMGKNGVTGDKFLRNTLTTNPWILCT
jgi:hypothetical protein